MTTIVMTGATSGIGAVACTEMLREPGTRVISGARREGPAGVETIPLELASLESARAFVATVESRLGASEIDALVLHAGVSFSNADGRTADGFETTFAINHLTQYSILRGLIHRMAHGARVTITTSGTHDPEQRTIIPPPRHANVAMLAHPERDPDRDAALRTAGGRAYSSSKLCNLLTARALASQPEARIRALRVIAYDPGPTPGTGLLRNGPMPVRAIWKLFGTPLRVLSPRMNSVGAAGSALAQLALGQRVPPEGHIYAALRRGRLTWPDPSELARRDDLASAVWIDSAALVGLAP